MAKQSSSKVTKVPTCTMCGKALPASSITGNTCGPLCASRQAQGYTPASYAAHKVTISLPVAPAKYITVAALHRFIVANPQHGCTVSRMVKCIGGDRGLVAPAHPICTPVYVGNVRYVHPWLGTQAGLQAMATGNYKGAPAVTLVRGMRTTAPTTGA